MFECGSEIEANESKVVPSFPTSVVEYDEGAAWCDRVGEKVVWCAIYSVVGGDRWKVGVRALKI